MASSDYWTVSRGQAVRFGWKCRECRKDISKGANIVARDGRKIRLYYHEACFSGASDPRTQNNSSFTENKFEKSFNKAAPEKKGHGRWSVESYGYNPASV